MTKKQVTEGVAQAVALLTELGFNVSYDLNFGFSLMGTKLSLSGIVSYGTEGHSDYLKAEFSVSGVVRLRALQEIRNEFEALLDDFPHVHLLNVQDEVAFQEVIMKFISTFYIRYSADLTGELIGGSGFGTGVATFEFKRGAAFHWKGNLKGDGKLDLQKWNRVLNAVIQRGCAQLA